jgi:hypothetical protein
MHVQPILHVFPFLFLSYGFRNACTSNRTCISYIYFFYLLKMYERARIHLVYIVIYLRK